MLSTLVSRSCCKFGHRALPALNRNALARAKIYANAFSTQLSFPDILEQPVDVQPVLEDVHFDDIVDDTKRFDNNERNMQVRIMSPSEATFSSIEQDESRQFDQDYDQYSLHMSMFQAYNMTHEESPHDLGLLEHEDVMNLNVVENYWERHPDAYSDELPPVSPLGGEEFAPDVEDI